MSNESASILALLTPTEMADADRRTIDDGLPGILLMESAARAIADGIAARYSSARRIAFLAGPGNNGGDAFAAARLIAGPEFDVRVFALVAADALEGDAATAARAFKGDIEPLDAFDPGDFDLVVDGLFGAGLSRPIEGAPAQAIDRASRSGVPVVAIDLPSGVSGDTGEILGTAAQANLTITFFRKKAGHLLRPGCDRCGTVLVADIGIDPKTLERQGIRNFENGPALWNGIATAPTRAGHKYDRGHTVVLSGTASRTGAARLAAAAALRAGSGLVTVASPASALLVNAAHLTAVMLQRVDDEEELAALLKDERLNAFVLGPGFGVGERARTYGAAILKAGRRLVLDADGITSFAGDPAELFDLAADAAGKLEETRLVLTPHAGEFARLFPDLAGDRRLSKLERARAASERAGAVVVLKGADTVIASPDRRAAINGNGTGWLATAGTGDVLAGIVAARLACGAPSFEAACAAVWMHGRAAEIFGAGLVSEDLPDMLPKVFAELAENDR